MIDLKHSAPPARQQKNVRSKPPRPFDWESLRQRMAAARAKLASPDQDNPEVLARLWAERAEQLAQVSMTGEASEQIQLATVRLGQEVYGLDVQCVRDVAVTRRITPVPRVPAWIVGVINQRGHILSVIDLQSYLGLMREAQANPPQTARSYLVNVETAGMEVALLVEEVLAVETLPTRQIQPLTSTPPGYHAEYIRGVAERREANGDAGVLIVLDLPTMLSDQRLIVQENL